MSTRSPPVSVNALLDHAADLDGVVVSVYGLYTHAFEDSTLHHLPGSERRGGVRDNIWVSYPSGVKVTGAATPSELAGKRVVVTGKLRAGGAGHGHGGLAAAEIVARRIARMKRLPGE